MDQQRVVHRARHQRSFLLDFVKYSSAYDYRLLRVIYNLPLGISIGYLIWVLSLSKLKVADWNETYTETLKWTLVGCMGLSFAVSPVFRCVSVLAALNVLSRQGQRILTVFILAMLMEGPIQHIVGNFERTADSAVCHMQLSTELAVQRVRLLTGPVEDHLNRGFGGSIELGRKVLEALKGIVDPFGEELSRTEEDDRLEDEDAKTRTLLNRLKALRGKLPSIPTVEPQWKKLKTKSAQLFAKRMQLRCNDIFNHAAGLCYDTLADIKDLCYKKVIWPIDSMFCGDFDVMNLCQVISKRTSSLSVCASEPKNETDSVITSDFDINMQNVENVSYSLNHELLLNLHFITIEKPRLLRIRLLQDIKMRLTMQTDWLKMVVSMVMSSLNAVLTIFVYLLFSDAYKFVKNYLTEINFNNRFTNAYFWHIDERRKMKTGVGLVPLTNFERSKFRLKKPLSGPTWEDIKKSLLPLLQWFAIALVVTGVVLLDHYYYSLLDTVAHRGVLTAHQKGHHLHRLTVEGDGFLANLTRSIIGFNYTHILDSELTNEHCLVVPLAPNWTFTGFHIFLPLGGMLLLQVLFSFMVARVKLFGVAGFIFRQRSKTRILHLYNKLLRERADYRRMARARIRYQVANEQLHAFTVRWTDRFWFQRVIDQILPTGRCLLCKERSRPKKLIFCERETCKASFCQRCYQSLESQCYACLAEEGKVSSEFTHVQPVVV